MTVSEFDTGLAKRMVHLYIDSDIQKTPYTSLYRCAIQTDIRTTPDGGFAGVPLCIRYFPRAWGKREQEIPKWDRSLENVLRRFVHFLKRDFI